MATITGDSNNNTLYGSAFSDAIYGYGGDDWLYGLGGNGWLYGGTGNDTLEGGLGADYLDGGDGMDFASYVNSTTGVYIDLTPANTNTNSISYGFYGEAAGDQLYGIDGIYGSAYGDTLIGYDGSYTDPSHPEWFYTNIFYGNGGNDYLDGAGGDDFLYGGDGNDSVIGGDGNDVVTGDAGDDFLYGDAGNDTVDGGLGNDYIDGGDGSDNLYGGDGNDTMWGDADNSTLPGNDYMDGGTGNDDMRGGGGNDTLLGGDGSDTLTGNAGDDVLDGGAGNDTLEGGDYTDPFGNDTLTGGTGDDLFWWTGANRGDDVITDFANDTGGTYNDGDQSNNDLIYLDWLFNPSSLAAYNAANNTNFKHPIQALNHDLADGVISFNGSNMSGPTLTMTGITGGLTWDQTNVVCFTSGTKIKTLQGEVAVEDLQAGLHVLTLDNGYQPLRWVGSRTLSSGDLAVCPNLRPIRIHAGALGLNQPETDLVVSPQHRVLVRSVVAERMFGESEILVAAKNLLALDGIDVAEDMEEVTYWHFLFDAHQVVFSNGAATESLFTGPEALRSVGAEAREEILAIFPGLAADPAGTEPVRLLIPGRPARRFAERIARNSKRLVA